MKKILKWGLWSILGIAATISSVIAYVALTFDPNAYKPQIIQAVKDSTQRTLSLDGDIKLMLFPSIGARLGKVALSEFNSEREFASVADASVSLAVMPLLKKQIVINQVLVSGVKVSIVKYKDGKTNIDDLLVSPDAAEATGASTQAPAIVAFDVASVAVENCELVFDDQSANSKLSISKLSFKTGRLHNAVPTPIEFSAHIGTTKPKSDIAVHMASTLTFDLERNRYAIKGLSLNAAGSMMDVSGLKLTLAGDATIDLKQQDVKVAGLAFDTSGNKAGEPFDVHLKVPAMHLKQDDFSGEHLSLSASLQGAFGKADAAISLPSFKGNTDKFNLQKLSLQTSLVQAEQSFSASVDTELIGSLKTSQFNLKDMSIALKASGDKLPGKVIESSLKGSVQADLERQSVQANFAGGLLQSQIKAKAAINNFNVPVIRYDLEIDKFDADPYLPPRNATKEMDNAKVPEQPLDLSVLKSLDMSGSLRIGALKAVNVKLNKLRIDLKVKDGIATIEPLSAALYQGTINGKVIIDANTSSFAITQKLSGVEIAPLMKDAAALELAEGKGNVSLAVTTQGNTVTALKQALNGTASLELADGAIRGIDLGKLVQGVQNLSKDSKAETMGVNKGERTLFSEFRANLKIKQGVAHNDDLSIKSTVLRLSGSGDVDIGHDKMDYKAKVIMAKTDHGRTGTLPVHVYGPFDALKIKVDYAELLADLARQRLDEEKAILKQKLEAEKVAAKAAAKARLDAEKAAAKSKAEEKLKQGLKGLLK